MIYKSTNYDLYLKSYREVFGQAMLNDITKW